MMREERGLERELVAFLGHHRIERKVPPEVRARALTGARAIIAAGGVVPRAAAKDGQPPSRAVVPTPIARGRARRRVALAASLAIAAGAVGAAAALQGRRDSVRVSSARPASPATLPSVPTASPGRAPFEAPAEAPAVPAARAVQGSALPRRWTHARRLVTRVDPFAAELDLLQRAHGAYTRSDFSTALTLVSEHARRFPRGNLAEQREALRVRSLAGAGRSADAHRAAAAFALRFPRSVLLPRIEDSSESPVP